MNLRFLFLILLFGSFRLSAEMYWDTTTREIHSLYFDLRFEEADRSLSLYQKDHPDNGITHYLEHLGMFYRSFVWEDPEVYEGSRGKMSDLVDRVDREPHSAWRSYCLSEMHLQQAALATKFGHDISAGFSAVRAHSALMDGREDYPDFPLLKTPHGLFLVTIGTLPEGFQNLASLIGMEGDIYRGMRYLLEGWQKADRDWSFLANKHAFVYLYSRFQIEDWVDLPKLPEPPDSKGHTLLQYVYAKHFLDEREPQKALSILSDMDDVPVRFPYMAYLRGKAELALNGGGTSWFLKYLSIEKGGRYRQAANRYLFWIEKLKGEQEVLPGAAVNISEFPSPQTGADKEAVWEIHHPIPVPLIRARVAFDGGRSNESLEILEGMGVERINEIDRQRWYYRKARCELDIGKPREAAKAFLLAVGGPDGTFEKAQSLLYLGQMMAEREEKELARKYFKRCLEQKGYPFVYGVQQKAKAGLKRL